MKFNAGCFGKCYYSSDAEIKSFGLTMGELWGGVTGWSYGMELWDGVMGQSYGAELWGGVAGAELWGKVLITLTVKLIVVAYLWNDNPGALHNHSTALTANFSLPAEWQYSKMLLCVKHCRGFLKPRYRFDGSSLYLLIHSNW